MTRCFSCSKEYETDYFTWFDFGDSGSKAICSSCMCVLARGAQHYRRHRQPPSAAINALFDFVERVGYYLEDGTTIAVLTAPYCDSLGTWRAEMRIDGRKCEWVWQDEDWITNLDRL